MASGGGRPMEPPLALPSRARSNAMLGNGSVNALFSTWLARSEASCGKSCNFAPCVRAAKELSRCPQALCAPERQHKLQKRILRKHNCLADARPRCNPPRPKRNPEASSGTRVEAHVDPTTRASELRRLDLPKVKHHLSGGLLDRALRTEHMQRPGAGVVRKLRSRPPEPCRAPD